MLCIACKAACFPRFLFDLVCLVISLHLVQISCQSTIVIPTFKLHSPFFTPCISSFHPLLPNGWNFSCRIMSVIIQGLHNVFSLSHRDASALTADLIAQFGVLRKGLEKNDIKKMNADALDELQAHQDDLDKDGAKQLFKSREERVTSRRKRANQGQDIHVKTSPSSNKRCLQRVHRKFVNKLRC